MSDYTTQVRFICETYANLTESGDSNSVDKVVESAMNKVFDFEYPIFDEEYRGVLQKKILKHYYTREIGAETVGLWKLWLNTKLNEIMPYYNQLYLSAKMEFNPLHDTDITRTHVGKGSNTGVVDGNSESWEKFSETPQGSIANLEKDEYLTNATKTTNNGRSNTSSNSTDEYIEKVTGKVGTATYSSLIKEYRNILINIDVKIIDELKDLFMNIW